MVPGQTRWLAIRDEEAGAWAAQCVDFNLCTQAPNIFAIPEAINKCVMSHIALSLEFEEIPFIDLAPVPQEYVDQYEALEEKSILSQKDFKALGEKIDRKLHGDLERARKAPFPEPSALTDHVYYGGSKVSKKRVSRKSGE